MWYEFVHFGVIVFLTFYGSDWPISTEFICGEEITHHDYAYQTVQVGDQCWFAENLRYLPQINLPDDGSPTEPRYYVYSAFGGILDEEYEINNYKILFVRL